MSCSFATSCGELVKTTEEFHISRTDSGRTSAATMCLLLCILPLTSAVLELPDEKDILRGTVSALPNAEWSSDHIALMAEFRFFY